jgi:anhydro-N-acetylmuramic acid kinase
MSGTSMDGIDTAVVDFTRPQPKLINTHSHPWPEAVQQALVKARDIPDVELSSLTSLDLNVAKIFAEAWHQSTGGHTI